MNFMAVRPPASGEFQPNRRWAHRLYPNCGGRAMHKTIARQVNLGVSRQGECK